MKRICIHILHIHAPKLVVVQPKGEGEKPKGGKKSRADIKQGRNELPLTK